MSEFSKTFLRERIGDEKESREVFGLFGKHPGWNDHIEDLPLPTASMAAAKQLLYVQGIGSQISSGAWARLAEGARLPDFDHAFLWIRGCQFLAGRMWASRDGKRRAHFPMIALVQAINVARDFALGTILAQLEEVAAGCRAARSADEVRNLIAGGWNGAAETPEGPIPGIRLTLDRTRESVLKLVDDFRGNRPPVLRLPADPNNFHQSLQFWSRVCTALAPAEFPLLFLAPVGSPWIDVLAGEPVPERFFCLRAGPPALPIAGEALTPGHGQEIDADDVINATTGGSAEGGERSWISRFLRH